MLTSSGRDDSSGPDTSIDMVSIVRATNDHQAFRDLVRLLDAELNARYGTLQAALDVYNAVEDVEAVVLAYVGPHPAGCACMKRYDGETVEVKRMYVKPGYRGMGIASRMLSELERWSAELGAARAVLETGEKQTEAIGLYQKHGYRQIENYGPYVGRATSICFEKVL